MIFSTTSCVFRCGSTLIAQMLYNQPNTRVLGEPFALVNVNSMYQLGETTPEENRALIKSSMRLHLKLVPGSQIKRIAIKFSGLATAQIGIMAEEFPQFKYVRIGDR